MRIVAHNKWRPVEEAEEGDAIPDTRSTNDRDSRSSCRSGRIEGREISPFLLSGIRVDRGRAIRRPELDSDAAGDDDATAREGR